MKTDILRTLQAVLLENTTSFQSDFEFDVTTLLEAADEPKIEDRTYFWLSRLCGTWCLKEKEVFLKGSAAYNIWTHYESEHSGFRAFRIVVEEKSGNALLGQVIPFDYGESVQRIKRAALPIMFITGEYGDGTAFSMSYADYDSDERLHTAIQHGGVKICQVVPESKEELRLRIAQEHVKQMPRKRTEKEKRKCVSR